MKFKRNFLEIAFLLVGLSVLVFGAKIKQVCDVTELKNTVVTNTRYNFIPKDDFPFKDYVDPTSKNILFITGKGTYMGCDLTGDLSFTNESADTDQYFNIIPVSDGIYSIFHESTLGFVGINSDGTANCSNKELKEENKLQIKILKDQSMQIIRNTKILSNSSAPINFYPVNYDHQKSFYIADFFPETFCSMCQSMYFKLKGSDEFIFIGGEPKSIFKIGYYRNHQGNFITINYNGKYLILTPASGEIKFNTTKMSRYCLFKVIINKDNSISLLTEENDYIAFKNKLISLSTANDSSTMFEKSFLNIVPGQETNVYSSDSLPFLDFYDFNEESHIFTANFGEFLLCNTDNSLSMNGKGHSQREKFSVILASSLQYYILVKQTGNYLGIDTNNKLVCNISNIVNNDSAKFEIKPSKDNKGLVLKNVKANGYLSYSNPQAVAIKADEGQTEVFFPYTQSQYYCNDISKALPEKFCIQCNKFYLKAKGKELYLKGYKEPSTKTVFTVNYSKLEDSYYVTLSSYFEVFYLSVSPDKSKILNYLKIYNKYSYFKIIKNSDNTISLETILGGYLSIDPSGNPVISTKIDDNSSFESSIKQQKVEISGTTILKPLTK